MDWFQASRLERLTFKLQHIKERRAPSFGKRREACARLEPGRPVKAIKNRAGLWKTQQLNRTTISLRTSCSSWRSRNDESSSDGRLYCETSNAWCGSCRCSSCEQRKQSGQPVQVQKQARPQVSTACAWLTPWIERQHWRSSTGVSSQKQHFRSLAAGLHLCKAPAAGGAPWKGNIPVNRRKSPEHESFLRLGIVTQVLWPPNRASVRKLTFGKVRQFICRGLASEQLVSVWVSTK